MNEPDASGRISPPESVVTALLEYRAAEEAMRRRTGNLMRMGAADLQALRFLLKAQAEDRIVTGRDLGDHMGMTSASVTGLLDRLTASGHVQRSPHPTSRRSNMITATPGSDVEVRETLGRMHARMISVASGLDAEQARLIASFLLDLTNSVDGIDVQSRG